MSVRLWVFPQRVKGDDLPECGQQRPRADPQAKTIPGRKPEEPQHPRLSAF